jgi:hypothetical protein
MSITTAASALPPPVPSISTIAFILASRIGNLKLENTIGLIGGRKSNDKQ